MPIRAGPEADRARLHEAARALETLVVKQLVTASKAFTGGEGAGSGVRADMFADALADAMVKGGGIGLAAQIERSMGGNPTAAPASMTTPTSISTSISTPTPTSTPTSTSTPTATTFDPLADALFSSSPTAPRLTSGFGARADPFTHREAHHAGVDLAEPEGAPVHALLGGVVRTAGDRGGYGQAVEIDHGNGVTTLYAHASELLVAPGDSVTQGQPVARVGHSGRATGAHLHFEVRVGGRAVDPAHALKVYARRADDVLGSGS
ncbi:MAG: peptidoglycan DD-metalloendopeptidase family protein [Anaeromyxobacteraceae bacterium]